MKTEIGRTPALSVRNLSLEKKYRDISFNAYPGEILGLGGLAGSGKSSLARTLFGLHAPDEGSVLVGDAREVGRFRPVELMKNRVAFLPSDRKSEGLFLDQSLKYNISIANLDKVLNPWIKKSLEKRISEDYKESINIKASSLDMTVGKLSGGNQQKVMVARWFCYEPAVLIFEEPTRGIDVNAKVEVYKLIGNFVSQGGAVIIVSSEVQELEGICDRVLVMHNGRISAELTGKDLNKERITYYSVTKMGEPSYENGR